MAITQHIGDIQLAGAKTAKVLPNGKYTLTDLGGWYTFTLAAARDAVGKVVNWWSNKDRTQKTADEASAYEFIGGRAFVCIAPSGRLVLIKESSLCEDHVVVGTGETVRAQAERCDDWLDQIAALGGPGTVLEIQGRYEGKTSDKSLYSSKEYRVRLLAATGPSKAEAVERAAAFRKAEAERKAERKAAAAQS